MNQRDGFASGFLAGSVVGGVVGGVIGAILASGLKNEAADDVLEPQKNSNLPEVKNNKGKRHQLRASTEQSIETARRSLEDKISQLNETIDEVRLTLGKVNGNIPDDSIEKTSSRE